MQRQLTRPMISRTSFYHHHPIGTGCRDSLCALAVTEWFGKRMCRPDRITACHGSPMKCKKRIQLCGVLEPQIVYVQQWIAYLLQIASQQFQSYESGKPPRKYGTSDLLQRHKPLPPYGSSLSRSHCLPMRREHSMLARSRSGWSWISPSVMAFGLQPSQPFVDRLLSSGD